jgi:hypothetical protein
VCQQVQKQEHNNSTEVLKHDPILAAVYLSKGVLHLYLWQCTAVG